MSQCGVLSRAQALGLGLSPAAIHRRLKSGRWERILPAVYRVSGSPSSWLQSLTAALLWAGDEAVAGGRSAAAIWQLEGCAEGPIDIIATRSRPAPGGIHMRQARVNRGEIVVRSGLRVTNAERTLLDLAGQSKLEAVEIALEDALRRRLTTLPRLATQLDSRWRCVPGAKPLRKLVAQRDPATRLTDTQFESKLFALLRKAKLLLPQPQFQVLHEGREIARVDFAYPDARFIIEAHSFRWHSGRRSWERDVQRDKNLRRGGWRILYVTYEDLIERPDQVIRDIRAGLSEANLFS